MKAVLLKGHGGFDQLEYREDVPVPEPEAHHVLVRIGAAGVNNTDINTRIGWYSRSAPADLADSLGRDSVDVVIDVVGGPGFGQLLEILRRRGRYAVAGAIAGPIVHLDLRNLYLKDLRLEGCTVFEPAVFRNLIGYVERGEVRPVVARVYAMSSIVSAQQEFSTKGHIGKIVLLP
jgi:NADPH:quinone reductase-like Zn-dependent oxidoreductase